MDETEKEFFNDLFEVKLKFITTRPYWNEPQAKPTLYKDNSGCRRKTGE